jgi:hypothetical protein
MNLFAKLYFVFDEFLEKEYIEKNNNIKYIKKKSIKESESNQTD